MRGKPPKSVHKSSPTMVVQVSSRVVNEAHLQAYDFSFKVYELIMLGHFLKIRGVIEPLIPRNTMLKEIIGATECRRERL